MLMESYVTLGNYCALVVSSPSAEAVPDSIYSDITNCCLRCLMSSYPDHWERKKKKKEQGERHFLLVFYFIIIFFLSNNDCPYNHKVCDVSRTYPGYFFVVVVGEYG